jgi:hyperosmotically inducible periplasmic protein
MIVRRALLCAAVSILASCGRPDSHVQATVRTQIATDPVTAPLNISVEVYDGVVYLSGETTTRAQQERAAMIAREVEGISGVMTRLTLSDAAIVEAVRRALAADPLVHAIPIHVEARRGIVRLMSGATNEEQRERAVAITKGVDGVLLVEDLMK